MFCDNVWRLRPVLDNKLGGKWKVIIISKDLKLVVTFTCKKNIINYKNL